MTYDHWKTANPADELLGPAPPPCERGSMRFTPEEKRDAARQEAKTRKLVYTRWINSGGTFSDDAARRIMILEEIAEDYGRIAELEEDSQNE